MLSVIFCVGFVHFCGKWHTNDDVFYEGIIYKIWAYCLCLKKKIKNLRYITISFSLKYLKVTNKLLAYKEVRI